MAEGFEVAKGYIVVDPDVEGFDEKLKAKLAGASGTATVGVDDTAADAKLDDFMARLAEATRNRDVSIGVDTARAAAGLAALQGEEDVFARSAAGAGAGISGQTAAMGALIAAGVGLSPVIATLGTGTAAFGLAAKSLVSPVLEAAGSGKKAAEAMRELDPAQQAAAKSLLVLKGDYAAFSKSLEPTVLADFNKGLDLASSVMSGAQPVAKAFGTALGGLLDRVDAEFQRGNWQNFFGFMAKSAGPDMQLVGNVLTDVLDTLPPLLKDLQPVARDIIQTADNVVILVGDLDHLKTSVAALNNLAPQTKNQVSSLSDSTLHLGGSMGKAADQIIGGLIPGADKLIPKVQNLWEKITGTDGAAKHLAGHTSDLANRTASAHGPAGVLGADLFVMQRNAGNASSAVDKLNSAWSTFLGLSTSLETAQIGVEGQLAQLKHDADKAGASFTGVNAASQALRNDFEANLAPSVQNVIDGMRKAHASSHDLASVVATDLAPAANKGALANKAMRQQIYDMAVQAGYAGPNQLKPLTGWIDKNATSLYKAMKKADDYAAALAKIPDHIDTTLTLRGFASWTIAEKFTGISGIAPGTTARAGGYASGTLGAEPGWAWVGEEGPELAYFKGGEVVVPTPQSRGIAGAGPAVIHSYAAGTGNAEKQYEATVASSLGSYANLGSLSINTAFAAGGIGAAVEAQLRQKLANLKRFEADLGALARAKVGKALIRQVVDLGPDAGALYAEAILSGGAGLIRQLNATEAAISKAEAGVSKTAGAAAYGQRSRRRWS